MAIGVVLFRHRCSTRCPSAHNFHLSPTAAASRRRQSYDRRSDQQHRRHYRRCCCVQRRQLPHIRQWFSYVDTTSTSWRSRQRARESRTRPPREVWKACTRQRRPPRQQQRRPPRQRRPPPPPCVDCGQARERHRPGHLQLQLTSTSSTQPDDATTTTTTTTTLVGQEARTSWVCVLGCGDDHRSGRADAARRVATVPPVCVRDRPRQWCRRGSAPLRFETQSPACTRTPRSSPTRSGC